MPIQAIVGAAHSENPGDKVEEFRIGRVGGEGYGRNRGIGRWRVW